MKKRSLPTGLEKIREKIREDPAQTRAFSHMVKFFLLMLLLTLIARGTSGATMARVELSRPVQQSLVHSLRAVGTAEARERTEVAVPAGLTVTGILVQPGATVEAGEPLVTFDPGDLEDALTRKAAQLQQLRVRMEILGDPQSVSDQAVTDARRELTRAETERDQAEAALSAAGDALAAAKAELSRARDALEGAETAEDAENARAAVMSAEICVREAEAVMTEAFGAAEASESRVQEEQARCQQAEADYAQARIAAERTDESNAAEAKLLQLEADGLEDGLRVLQELQEAACCLRAPTDGRILDIPLTRGAVTGGSERITMTAEEGGYLLTFQTGREDAGALQAGGMVLTVCQGGNVEEISRFQVSAGEDPQTVTVTAILNTPGWSGEPVSVTAVLSQESYATCVPVSAVHQDAGGTFLYVYQSRVTILGVRNVAVRVDVILEDSDGAYAAVTGDITREDSVITASSKPLSSGDRVRVAS